MFKSGDDLRQDQLVLQMITLMDGFLLQYGLDLKLTPYRVLAMSPSDGFVEWVPDSQTLASVVQKTPGQILGYLGGVSQEATTEPLDYFAKSCAGTIS